MMVIKAGTASHGCATRARVQGAREKRFFCESIALRRQTGKLQVGICSRESNKSARMPFNYRGRTDMQREFTRGNGSERCATVRIAAIQCKTIAQLLADMKA